MHTCVLQGAERFSKPGATAAATTDELLVTTLRFFDSYATTCTTKPLLPDTITIADLPVHLQGRVRGDIGLPKLFTF